MTDYFVVLFRAIQSAQSHSAQTRAYTYGLARSALRRELLRAGLDTSEEQAKREQAALEQAIWRVELLISRGDDTRSALARLRERQGAGSSRVDDFRIDETVWARRNRREISILPPRDTQVAVTALVPRRDSIAPLAAENITICPSTVDAPKRPRLGQRALVLLGEASRMAVVGGAAVAIYVAISEPNNWMERLQSQFHGSTTLPTESASRPHTAAISKSSEVAEATPEPLRPAAFGVYAIHDHKIVELRALPTAPVDPRLKNVLQTNQPGAVRISSGKLSFLVYERDFAVRAPEKVPVKIVAPIVRSMKFDGAGKVATIPQSDIWLIRSNGYEFQVVPIANHREMIAVRPEDPEFLIPPGRYALIVNEQPYDFLVDGAVRDPAHCVESVPTARGPVFYDCPPG